MPLCSESLCNLVAGFATVDGNKTKMADGEKEAGNCDAIQKYLAGEAG